MQETKIVLRKVINYTTGSLGEVIYQKGMLPLSVNRSSYIYTVLKGRATRLRDLRRRHVVGRCQ
jgi:hypothetical protein